MPSIVYCLLCLFFTNILLEPTTCAIPEYLQNIELDDITSLWDKFPSIIGQIKQAVNRFRCPKGWRRLGGSCYYLSNLTSTPYEANYTCNQLHSNHSNLMQIRNTVELFYAAHILTKYNLSALMIELDPNLLKGKTMTDILLEDQGRWQRMKEKFREIRVRYYKLKDKIVRELEEAGLRISQRSKKIKQSIKRKKQKYLNDQVDMYDDYDYIENAINQTNHTIEEIDEYEYENLDDDEEDNEFEHMDDIAGICDQVDWNVLDSNTTVYMLTTFLIDDRIVCSISNVEQDLEYEHLCEYVLDFCFANIICGKHGRCVNTLSGFKCSCSFLYGGVLCEKISRQGKQIIFSIIIIIFLYTLSFKPIRWALAEFVSLCASCLKRRSKKNKWTQEQKEKDDKKQLVNEKKTDEDSKTKNARRATIAEDIMEFIMPKPHPSVQNPTKRDLSRLYCVGVLTVFYLALLLLLTTTRHFSSFKYDVVNHTKIENLLNDTIRMVAKCGSISNYRTENLVFFPIAVAMIFFFSWSIKREKKCLFLCDGRPGLIPPIEPFRTGNRLTTATVFGILAFEVLKIFEEILFASADPFNRGVLVELLERIVLIILIGLRYYPVLASLQLRNFAVRFFTCLYMIANIVYTIIREGACMGYLPLAKYYSPIEEAKLRMELGTWFIIYGLVKNTPHFGLLSYITAELCVRFVYDSIYVPLKKKQSIWLSPVAQLDEYAFAKFYVTRLFRRNVHTARRADLEEVDIDDLIDYEHENRSQAKRKPSKIKKYLNEIYTWNDDFRFTTIATCTYTVAVVFLYYLACTLVFLYTSRTAGHISFIRHYIESTLHIEFKGFFSLRSTIFWSAFITFVIYVYQLFLGMKNYKKHKLQLLRGIYEDVPSTQNFKANSIAAKSVHYSGFLVGYMAWGFVICFHLIFFIMIIIRIASLQIRYFEIVLAFTVPVLVVYLLKMVSISSAGKFFFIQDAEEKLNLKNRKVYAIFVYFNFFADCFLGIASCIIRLCKATFLNIVYMARLDCSFLGRPLEKFDLGFAAYVSYLHMEVTHTNPIMVAFCYSLYEDVVKRRPKHCYDDECCIAPGELYDEDEQPIEKKTTTPRKSQIAPEKKPEPITEEEEEDDDDDDDDGGLSVKEEIKPKAKSKSPSITSDRSSQRSKQKKSSIDDDESRPAVSAIARLIPEVQPRLPPISPEPPPVPKREDIPTENDDDDEDDDGGVKPATTSTIEKIIPQEVPRLLPMQRSSPPPAKNKNKDNSDDEDDDGGMGSRKSTPPKKEPAEKKKKKQVEKHDNDDDEDEDDDGGVKPPSISTISKMMPKKQPHLSPFQNASAPPRPSPPKAPQRQDIPSAKDDDDEDDGGINPKVIAKQRQEAEKKKKKKEEEIKKKKQIAADDDGFDDDGGVNPKTKKPKDKKTKSQSKVPLIFEDEDDDGGVSKEKRQAEQKKKQELEAKKKQKEQLKKKIQQDNDDDDDGASKKKPKPIENKKPATAKHEYIKDDDEDDDGGRTVKTFDTIRTIMPSKQPALDRTSKSKSKSPEQQEPILKSIEIVGRLASPIRREDNHYDTIPTDEERLARTQAIYSPPSYTKATADTDESYPLRSTSYREAQQAVPVTTKKSSIRSRSTINEDSSHYSEITNETASSGVINRSYSHAGSNHSIKRQNKQEQQTEESEIESEQEELVKKKPTRKTLEPLPNISTAHQTLNYLVKPKEAPKIQEVARKRVARFRWFLAYTIINNYHLFDLRKQAQSRLARLRISRSNLYDDAQHAAAAVAPVVQSQVPETRAASIVAEVAPAAAVVARRLLSVPVPVVDDYPQSPAERYVAIRSAMLYDANAQQSDTSRSQAPSIASQQVRFKETPTVIVQPPSEGSTKSKRPSFEREATTGSDPVIVGPLAGTPMFQAIPESVQSTADYPLANGSSISNVTTLRTQMSHAQHMRAWRHEQLKKIQKKRTHCYHYGAPLQKSLEEKIATAAILTPQIIDPQLHRSPFQNLRQMQTINETQPKTKAQSSSSATTTTTTNASDNSSVRKKKIRATSSMMQRKDSPDGFSNATEV